MPDRYYARDTGTELFVDVPAHPHLEYDAGNPEHFALPDTNPFFSQLPVGERLTYDGSNLPDGTELDPNLPANNLTLAIASGLELLKDAVREANEVLNVSDGTYTYDLDDDKIRYLGTSDGSANLEDDTGVVRTLSAGVATTLKDNWEIAWEANQTNKVLKAGWISGAPDVAGVNTILANTPFPNLGPV